MILTIDLKISQLRYVLAIVECGSFSQAAKKLYISQPSLSEYIINLEKHLGVVLFDRATTPIRPTCAGEHFIKTATQILEMTERLQRELNELADTPQGHVIVGASQFVTTYIIPRILTAFKKKFPKIDLSLVEVMEGEREEATLKGGIDLFFTTSPVKHKRLQYISVMPERILLALPLSHRLNRPGAKEWQECQILPALHRLSYPYEKLPSDKDFPRISLEDVQNDPFVMLRSGQSLNKLALNLCREANFTPKILLESRSIDAIQAMVVAGLGNAFIPESLVRFSDSYYNHPIFYQIDHLFPVRDLNVAYRRDCYQSKAVQEFINTVREVLHNPIIG